MRELEAAPRGPDGIPDGAAEADARLIAAARKDLFSFLGLLFTVFGTRPDKEATKGSGTVCGFELEKRFCRVAYPSFRRLRLRPIFCAYPRLCEGF